ncbi:MAG: PilZ domain-containing protein [Nitrospirota bacterium]
MINPGKRRYKRFVVEQMDINAKTLFATGTELLNLSIAGACVKANKSLKLDHRHLIKLGRQDSPFTLQSVVVWENLSDSLHNSGGEIVPVYRAGIAFNNVSPDKLIKLKDFIRESGIPNETRISDEFKPSFLRFKIHDNKKAVMYHTKVSAVKKISLGGMLIELPDRLQIESRFPMALFLTGEGLPIKFQGRIASCIEHCNTKSSRFDVGIEFMAMEDNDRLRLNKFISCL